VYLATTGVAGGVKTSLLLATVIILGNYPLRFRLVTLKKAVASSCFFVIFDLPFAGCGERRTALKFRVRVSAKRPKQH
jgi:hypothetical protein